MAMPTPTGSALKTICPRTPPPRTPPPHPPPPCMVRDIIISKSFHLFMRRCDFYVNCWQWTTDTGWSQQLTLSTSCSDELKKTKQEAHGPWFAHLSDIATADMQMLCNIFPVLSSQLMKISSFEQLLILKKNIWAWESMEHDHWINYQSHFNRRINVKFGGNWLSGFWRIMILYM